MEKQSPPDYIITPTTTTNTNKIELIKNPTTFLLHNNNNNGFHTTCNTPDNIEMITIPSISYTSLKDILPNPNTNNANSPPTTTNTILMSPNVAVHNSSWHEIPIKDPLLKHAAWAYLQPTWTPPEVSDKGFFHRLKDQCFNECHCFSWLGHVVLDACKGFSAFGFGSSSSSSSNAGGSIVHVVVDVDEDFDYDYVYDRNYEYDHLQGKVD